LNSNVAEDKQTSNSIKLGGRGVNLAIACARLMNYESQSSCLNDTSKHVSFLGLVGNNAEAEAL
jgi:hypothetical protein